MATYVGKVTSAGQITIPKKVREVLELSEEDLVEFRQIGDAVLMQKMKVSKSSLKAIRAKIRRMGMTRERVEEIVEEVRKEMWSERWE
ncbi:MAG: AbrB/MazE/SpoVT family DNA-binding domain-containing protein [Thermoplasmata archaeon]